MLYNPALRLHVLLLSWFIAILVTTSLAQIEEEWVRRYNGPANLDDRAAAIAVDASGNVFVVGTSSNSNGTTDIAIVKYNATGSQLWVRRYGSADLKETAAFAAVDAAGSIYVTGKAHRTTDDIVTLKYDTNGNRVWSRFYDRPVDQNFPVAPDDYPSKIRVDDQGNSYVAGVSNYDWACSHFFTVIKYNTAGNLIWVAQHEIGRCTTGAVTDLELDDSGNAYITGYADIDTIDIDDERWDYVTIKYNADGKQQWLAQYDQGYHGYDYAQAAAVDAEGNVYITGESNLDYTTIKYNSNGTQLWARDYNGPVEDGWDYPRDIQVDYSGNVYVTGQSESIASTDYLTIKYNPDGDRIWARRYASGIASAIELDGTGAVYVAGSAFGNASGSDYAIIKYDNAGNEVWVKRYNGPGSSNDAVSAITIDADLSIYVTGSSAGSATGYDFATIKYRQTSTGDPTLSLMPENRDVPSTAGNTTFDVSNTGGGTMTWTAAVTSNSPWLSITSGGSGTNNGTITTSYSANSGSSERIGTITVTAQNANASPTQVTVRQAGTGSPTSFYDDFNRQTIGPNWQLDPAGGTVSIVSYPPDGKLQLSNPAGSGTDTRVTLIAPNTVYSDVTVEFDFDNGLEETQINNTRIYLRFANADDGYVVAINEDNTQPPSRYNIKLQKRLGGTTTRLDMKEGILLQPGRYQFSINRQLLRFRNLNDGTTLLEGMDSSSLPAGRIAFAVNEETTRFDNVSIFTQQPLISGFVRTGNGSGITGVTLAFSNGGGSTATDASGNYSQMLSYGWSGTVTPSKAGYTFTPVSRSYTNVTIDDQDEDYTGTAIQPLISGRVSTSGGSGISEVTLAFSNNGGSTTTDANGNYKNTVGYGWNGTVTPSKATYSFNPSSRSYSNVTSNRSNEDYTATANNPPYFQDASLPSSVTHPERVYFSGTAYDDIGLQNITMTVSGPRGNNLTAFSVALNGVTSKNLNAYFFDSGNTTYANQAGSYTVTLTIIDTNNQTKSQNFNLAVFSFDAPTGLLALAQNSNTVQLTWQDKTNNEQGFKIERRAGDSGTFAEIATVSASTTSYTDGSLPSNQIYYYRVRAYTGSLFSDYSNIYSAVTLAAPSNLSATAMSATQINLQWNDISNSEHGFKIERKLSESGNWLVVADRPAGSTSYLDNGLLTGTTYYYRVRAYANSTTPTPHYSDYSGQDSETPHELECTGAYPDVKTAFAADLDDDFMVNSLDLEILKQYWGTDGTNYISYRSPDINENGVVDASDLGIMMYFWEKIVPAAVVVSASPMIGAVNLSWDDVSGHEGGFLIERKQTEGGSWSVISSVAANSESYQDAGAIQGVEYSYRVRAYADNTQDLPYYSCYSNEERILVPTISYGTTIIAHGYNRGNNLENDAKWTLNMAKAIAQRLHNGQVYAVRQGRIDGPLFDTGSEGEKIIVFDWLEESDRPVFGYAEGAADALSGILLHGAIEGVWSLNQLHFIGHSRGTIVLSETIQRLGFYARAANAINSDLSVDQDIHFTLLDAHPWDNTWEDYVGDPLTAEDNDVNGNLIGKGVVCWQNVAYADNYWHYSDPILDPLDLNGLKNILGCSFVKDLSQFSNFYMGMSHSGVHAWYHGTIDHNALDDGDGTRIGQTWYPGNEEFSTGFYYAMPTAAISAIRTANTVNIFNDHTFQGSQIFNGDFNKNSSSLNFSGIPGWELQGGGGNGHVNKYVDLTLNPYLVLDRSNHIRTHNWFYIPNYASKISYRLKVANKSEDDLLKVYIGNTIADFLRLDKKLNYQWRSFDVARYRGSVETITFEIDPVNAVDSEVWIDDVGFEVTPYISATVACPVDLHAYDSSGNHTGPINDSTWVTEIPGSQYHVENDTLPRARKTIVLPRSEEGSRYTFMIESRNTAGYFGFQVDEVTGDSQTISAVFDSVAIEANTNAICALSAVTPEIALSIDMEGDGNYETTSELTRFIRDFRIVATSESNGTIIPSDTNFVNYGDSLIMLITPENGYKIADVLVDSQSIGTVSTYTFRNVKEDHRIHALFSVATGLPSDGLVPAQLMLYQNNPNPFSAASTITFDLPAPNHVKIRVYNLLGQNVRTLVDGHMGAGQWDVLWNGRDDQNRPIPSGLYLYRMEAGSFIATRRLLLLR